jgi:hypothetical protein
MAKKKKEKDYSRYKIDQIIEGLSKSQRSDWGKYLLRASMDDSPSTIDIRYLALHDDGTYNVGKGISLTDEEADKLTDSLITNGFGNIVTLAREYKHRKETYYSNISDEDLENGTC